MKKTIYVYLLDGLADWEIAYLLPTIKLEKEYKKEKSQYELKSVGFSKEPIISGGGLTITPDLALEDVDFLDAGGLILPGSDSWDDPKHQKIIDAAEKLLEIGIMVAAICGATMALAKRGILNHYVHTSNEIDYLKSTLAYLGEDKYVDSLSVTDANLITSGETGALEFMMETMNKLDLFPEEFTENWHGYYKTGEIK